MLNSVIGVSFDSVAGRGTIVFYKNSYGFAELAVNRGSSRNILDIKREDELSIVM